MKTFEQYNKKEYTIDDLEIGDKIMLDISGYPFYGDDIKNILWGTYKCRVGNTLEIVEYDNYFFYIENIINHIKKEDWDESLYDSEELGLI